jgi:transposase-like protein
MKCESCKEEMDDRIKVRSNGWSLWVCSGCQPSFSKISKIKGKKGGKK